MKTAISVPDELLARAEAEITESYDRLAAKFDTGMDPVLDELQRLSLVEKDVDEGESRR